MNIQAMGKKIDEIHERVKSAVRWARQSQSENERLQEQLDEKINESIRVGAQHRRKIRAMAEENQAVIGRLHDELNTHREITAYERCPYDRCGGVVVLDKRFEQTGSPVTGIDRNRRTDTFKCRRCGKQVQREWSWERLG